MNSLQQRIAGLDTLVGARLGGVGVELQPIAGEVPVIQVVIEGRNELPIFITTSDAQILCICYLWTESEVAPAKRTALLEAMLDLNVSIPLSSFGKVDDRYVLFGALAAGARMEDIALDVAALSDNALDALEALSDYLA